MSDEREYVYQVDEGKVHIASGSYRVAAWDLRSPITMCGRTLRDWVLDPTLPSTRSVCQQCARRKRAR